MDAKKTLKTAGSVAGAAVMMSGTLMLTPMAALALGADAPTVPAQEATAEQDAAIAEQGVAAARVEGTFAFSQDALTSNGDIASLFRKAAATLCEGLPVYDAGLSCDAVQVTNLDANTVCEATIEELTEQTDVENLVIGCACSSNMPGGGAIANAEVSGIPVAAVAALVAAF